MNVNEAKGCKSVTIALSVSDDTQMFHPQPRGGTQPGEDLDMLSTLTSIYAPRLFALLKDRKGVSAMEYAVLAVAIVAAVGLGDASLGGSVQSALTGIGTSL